MDVLPVTSTGESGVKDISQSPQPLAVSVVVPIYNELESLPTLIASIHGSLTEAAIAYELLCVDDGSTDGSAELLKKLALVNPNLRVIILRRNYGQTSAMSAGFNHAKGEVIVTLDGDLQNDPADIPSLLEQLSKGYDVVSGWRKNRQDDFLTRLLPSKIANWLIGKITGVQIHDYGCSLKAYRAELVADMKLYGELHRFLPVLAFIEGARVTELPVRHHPRRYGRSKYGLSRTFRVLMDLFTIAFIKTFLTRPMHVFGLLGFVLLLFGVGAGGYLSFIRLVLGVSIGQRPLLMLAVLLTLTGIQLLCFGLLAELLMRTYHESQNRPIYRVRELIESSNSSSK